jgi:predicted acetyltransferase
VTGSPVTGPAVTGPAVTGPAATESDATELRLLETDDDLDQAWLLSTLAFGGDLTQARTPPAPGRVTLGAFDDGRLLAKASLRSYAQWWGGRRVPMGGVAGVAVHPEARGRGLASRVVRGLLPLMAERGQVVSALFPTVPGLYRQLGWEVAGSLDETPVPTGALVSRPAAGATAAEARRAGAGAAGGMRVRAAGPGDVPALGQLYDAHGAATAGLLTRAGPSFPAGPGGLLGHEVVTLAESAAGEPLGYVAYDRGRGYSASARLRVRELVTGRPDAAAALLATLASWDPVVPQLLWRGPTDQLELLLGRSVGPPSERQPWMLRVTDAPAAVAARGFAPGIEVRTAFVLDDPDVPGNSGPWGLHVTEGRGALERLDDPTGLPVLAAGGLALLYAGAADTGLLLRSGLLDAPLPGADAAFAGPRPRLLDYF